MLAKEKVYKKLLSMMDKSIRMGKYLKETHMH